MKLLHKDLLRKRINSKELDKSIIVEPVLDNSQIGQVCVDLRLDTHFYVPIKSHISSIDVSNQENLIEKFFEKVYRDIGEKFIVFPGQFFLANTLEFIRLPKNVFGELVLRSSYNRLGLHSYSVVQPGYAGTLTLEIKNNSETPIELFVGSRIVQMKFFISDEPEEYTMYEDAKYICPIEPQLSKCFQDSDLEKIQRINKYKKL